MCTLTFVPTVDGFLVGMNRDELLTRPKAFLPQLYTSGGMEALYPREPSGGTWIACNNIANLLAILNWNEFASLGRGRKMRSRGIIIPKLIVASDFSSANSHYERMALDGLLPFRLVGVFWREGIICEWCWDGTKGQTIQFPWARKHWFSSSVSDSSAERARGRTCRAAALQPASATHTWLRTLHSSHEPAPGPFSVCVHRPDAATVSYTEVRCAGTQISMDYAGGSPCLKRAFDRSATLSLKSSRSNLI